jgi:hypothetical protein
MEKFEWTKLEWKYITIHRGIEKKNVGIKEIEMKL